jgi:flavin reductase (DIM6/NTAB) family NADH-FMN oxidoreductase RutF
MRAGFPPRFILMRNAVPDRHVHRLLNHGPVTLVTTAHEGRRNVMAAAWVMPLDFEPAKFIAVIAADTFTRELLLASRQCVVQAPTDAQIDLVYAVGTTSGRDGDKFAHLGIQTSPAKTVLAPLIEGCAAWIECDVIDEPSIADRYDLFVLQAKSAWADDTVWKDGSWNFASGLPRTIHHEKGGRFFTTGEPVQARR